MPTAIEGDCLIYYQKHTSNMSNPISLTQVRDLPSGSWVNDGFHAVVLEIVPKQAKATGRNFWVCKIGDPANPTFSLEMARFQAPNFQVGSRITATGQGIKYEVGNYGGKVSTSDKTQISVNGTAPMPQTANPGPVPAPQGGQAFPTPQPGTRQAPEGQTIGMAIKLAGDLLMHNARVEAKPIDLASLSGNLWEIAGAIIEASDGLKSGVKPETTPF